MSMFGTIMSKIFGHPAAAAATSPGADAAASSAAPAAGGAAAAMETASSAATPPQTVDVVAVLTQMSAQNPQQLNWRTSIVDLMKLLGLDSSLQNRQLLATELGYPGDQNDSASMNIWLHKQVMTQLAENGGKVPDDLKV